MAFVHLHNHTVFSMLDGATRIQDMVNRAVELGMPAVAITDHGYMYGVPDLALACDATIRPSTKLGATTRPSWKRTAATSWWSPIPRKTRASMPSM